MKAIKQMLRVSILAGLVAVTGVQTAAAWGPVNDLSVQDGDMVVSTQQAGVDVQFTTASVWGQTYISNPNGHGAYIRGDLWNTAQNAVPVETGRNYQQAWQYAHGSRQFGGATQSPWYGKANVCVDKPWWFDPCSGDSNVVQI